jgi:hypothetical protein
MILTRRINLAPALEDDDATLNALAFKAIGAIFAVFLAITLASAGVLLYVLVTDRASAGDGIRLELLGGQCQGEPMSDGNWYSHKYPHEFHFRSRCWQVAISEILAKRAGFDLGVRFGYADLGNMGIDALWWLRDEDFASTPDGLSCTLGIDGNAANCLGNGRIRQRVKGFTFGGLAERQLARYLRLGVEGGLYLYEGSFQVWVEPYPHPDSYTGWTNSYTGIQLSPYFGATLNSGPLMLSARVYTIIRAAEHGCGGCSGPTKGPVRQLTAGLSWPF